MKGRLNETGRALQKQYGHPECVTMATLLQPLVVEDWMATASTWRALLVSWAQIEMGSRNSSA